MKLLYQYLKNWRKNGMKLDKVKIGYAVTGSFCTFQKMLVAVENLVEAGADIFPIMSEISYTTDTRFGKSQYFIEKLEELSGRSVIKSVKEAEPIGPKKLLDLIIVAPCTGNTLAKIANGITDSSVTMAVKAHLRNSRPVVLGVSTNDALGNSAKNIGSLLNYKNIYFVPFEQDDFETKPASIVSNFDYVVPACSAALSGKQLQPILLR